MGTTDIALAPAQPRTGHRRRIILAILIAMGVAAYLFQPLVAAWLVRRWLVSAATARHLVLHPGQVEADFLSGKIHLGNPQLTSESQPDSKLQIDEIEVHFSPLRALFWRDQPPVSKLQIGKVSVHWVLRPIADREVKISLGSGWQRWFPASITCDSIDGDLSWPESQAEVQDLAFEFHPGTAGTLTLSKLAIKSGAHDRVFAHLSGVTAIKDRALYVGGVKFSDALQLERGTLDFQELDRGKITSETQFSAFEGQLRADTQIDLHKSPSTLDVAATFWNISVGQVGAFAGNPALASGTIHEGRFTFRGNPVEAARGTITLRLNATGFQWRERQWQSLVASALLVNRRLEIPQFSLTQDKNQIDLNGSMAMPDNWKKLPAQFQFNIQAQIDDLAEAATLLAPGQKAVAGEAFFAGTLGSKDGQFSGRLKMRGGPLTISGVAIDRVRGDLDLSGSEVSALNLEFAHREDRAKGWATYDFGGQGRYSGQFDLNARDIADYQAILPASIAGHAVAGGAGVWWNGDGTSGAHSGAFKITLNDFILSRAAEAVQLDVETHGSYSPGGITLNHLRLARPDTTLDAMVVVRPDSLEIRDLKAAGKAGAEMEGNLVLPVNILAALQTPTLAALLESKSAIAGRVSAQKMELGALAELSGRRWPVRGKASFDLTASGLLEQLAASGSLALDDFKFTHGETDYRLPEGSGKVELAEGRLRISGQISPAPGSSVTGSLEAGLKLNPANLAQGLFLDPSSAWSGTLTGKDFPVEFLHPWLRSSRDFWGEVDGDLTLAGTAENPVWTGKLLVREGRWRTDFLEWPLKRLTGALELTTDGLRFTDFAGEYRGGKFSVTGRTGFATGHEVTLNIKTSDLPLSESEGFTAVMDGNLTVSGPAGARALAGSVLLKRAVMNRVLKPVMTAPAVEKFRLPWVPPDWAISLNVSTEGDLIMGNAWPVKPQLWITGTAWNPLFTGTLQAGEKFSVAYLNAPLEEGLVDFFPSASSEGGGLDLEADNTVPGIAPPTLERRGQIHLSPVSHGPETGIAAPDFILQP